MPKYDHFSLMLADTPNGWTPVVNQAEREYLRERFEKIEKSRKEENEKSLLKCRENDNDFEARMNTEIPEPQPNPAIPTAKFATKIMHRFQSMWPPKITVKRLWSRWTRSATLTICSLT